MFQKVFEYAGPHKKGLYAATAVVLVSVLMGVLPFVLAYQVISPLVMGETIDASFIILRVVLVLVCLVLQAILYGWGLNISHKAAYDTLLRLRTALQKRFEKLPLGVIQDKGTGTVKTTVGIYEGYAIAYPVEKCYTCLDGIKRHHFCERT